MKNTLLRSLLLSAAFIAPFSAPEAVLASGGVLSAETLKKHETKELIELMQMDIDMWYAATQAIKKLENQGSNLISKFQDYLKVKEEQIQALEKTITEAGGTPPSFKKDPKGYIEKAYIAVREKLAVDHTKALLEAFDSILRGSVKVYDMALPQEIPATVREMIEKHHESEKEFLAFVQAELAKA